MCILLWTTNVGKYKLIFITNREERFERKTSCAHKWNVNDSEIIAGKDLVNDHTWLAISNTGKFSTLSNLKIPKSNSNKTHSHSRGELVTKWFNVDTNEEINYDLYKPFHLLYTDLNDVEIKMFYTNYIDRKIILLDNKINIIENVPMSDKIDRVVYAEKLFEQLINEIDNLTLDNIIQNSFSVLDKLIVERCTHEPLQNEWVTRGQTVIVVDNENNIYFIERVLMLDSLIIPNDDLKRNKYINNVGTWLETRFEILK